MHIHQHARPLREQIASWRAQGECIAFVPTMGNLHQGHLSLVETARQQANARLRTVVSIFVNPMQFGENEDFDTYPRTLEDDISKLQQAGVDMLYVPAVSEIYPGGVGAATRVLPPAELTELLEGESRPGFFTGVATVVNTLFNIVRPDIACFGEKDFQQLLVIRRMVTDLAMPIRVLSAPIVREPDGLAMSSRNRYLDAAERATAGKLYVCLQHLVSEVQSGADSHYAVMHASQELENHGFVVDYVVIRRQQDLAVPGAGDTRLVALAAAWLGKTRLIDNMCFEINKL